MDIAHAGHRAWRGRVFAGLRRLRERFAARRELLWHSEPEVGPIAAELGLDVTALREFVRRGPRAANELPRMLTALGLNTGTIARRYPLLLRDLQRVCASCRTKARCNRELACATAAAHFEAFCPNRETLKALR